MKRALLLLVLVGCTPRPKTDVTRCRFLYTDFRAKGDTLVTVAIYDCKGVK